MATFNQQGQKVHYQFNDVVFHFGSVSDTAAALQEVRKLSEEVHRAAQAGALDSATGREVKNQLDEAMAQMQKPAADKGKVLSCIEGAKGLIQDIGSVAGLAAGFAQAAAMIGRIF